MNIKTFKIGNYIIGKPKTVFLVAEIGINHNGNFNLCKKMIMSAAKSGANAVKLQTIDPNESYLRNTPSYKEFLNKNFSDEELYKLKEITEKLGLVFFSTPGDFKSLERLKKIGVKLIKISSGLLTNIPLIEQVSRSKIPMIISTGMAYEKEIYESVKVARKYSNKGVAVLKCTSLYPAPDKTINLSSMVTLRNKLSIPVGYSDHTVSVLTPSIAVALGAKFIEKHVTLNKNMTGPDHKASLNFKEFKVMVNLIRKTEKLLGSSNKIITNSEKKNIKHVRKSIVASKNIKRGSFFSKFNLTTKRPGNGLSPFLLNQLYGKKAKKNFELDDLISI